MEIPVSARIGYVTSTDGDYISLEVEDQNSHVTFVRARFKLEEGYKLFMNRETEGSAEVVGLNLVGKKREVKEITLSIPFGNGLYGNDRDAVLKVACVDWMKENPGWQISPGDMSWNTHKAKLKKGTEDWTYSIHAVRFT